MRSAPSSFAPRTPRTPSRPTAPSPTTATVQPYLDRGEVVAVLEEYRSPFPGYYLYYPQRRQASPALRALIDYLLRLRQSQPPRA